MIPFPCPGCGKPLKVKDEAAGQDVKCPGCGRTVRVPESVPPASGTGEAATLPPVSPPAQGGSDLRSSHADTFDDENHGEGSELTDFLAPAQAPDEIGRLGPYRVLQVLGAGGMGVVYKAEDPQLQRPVALKAMLPALAASASARQRFLRE